MPLAPLKRARWILSVGGGEVDPTQGGYPTLHLEFSDGKQAFVQVEQKMLWRGFNAVYLDMDLTEDTSVTIDGTDYAGFTDNPEIVQLTKDFVAAVMDGKFAPQDIINKVEDLES